MREYNSIEKAIIVMAVEEDMKIYDCPTDGVYARKKSSNQQSCPRCRIQGEVVDIKGCPLGEDE